MESTDLLRHLEKEIDFEISLGSADLLRHLEKEILFKVAMGWGSIEVS